MNNRDREEAIGIACGLWRHLSDREWDLARAMLADSFEALWPQSREQITSPDNFIAMNRECPGEGEIQVQNTLCGYDQWDKVYEVATTIQRKWTRPDGTLSELYVIAFVEIDRESLIQSVTEYWADTYPAPEWRRKYVEVY